MGRISSWTHLFRNNIGRTYRPLQSFFHLKFAGIVIPAFWGGAIAMAGLALAVGGDDYFYHWAYGFVVLATVWSLGYWFTSETLEKKRTKTKRQRRGLDPYSQNPFYGLMIFGCICILVSSFLTAGFVHSAEIRGRLRSFSDLLLAGNKPTPDNVCRTMPDGALRILLGPMAAWSTRFPSNVISIDNEPMLSLEKNTDNGVAISTNIYDRNHDIIAAINHNHYDIDSSVFRVTRESLSDLAVVVRHDKEEVLHIQYLNPTTISITGVFRTRDAVLKVDSDGVYLNGRSLGHLGICGGNAGAADFAFDTH